MLESTKLCFTPQNLCSYLSEVVSVKIITLKSLMCLLLGLLFMNPFLLDPLYFFPDYLSSLIL